MTEPYIDIKRLSGDGGVVIYRPDCLIAIQLSCELDMASSVLDMSSLSWVPSMDSRE